MKDIEDLLKEIGVKAEDNEIKYLYGVEYSSDSNTGWKALVRFSKDGVAPVVFSETSKSNLKAALKRYISGDELKDVITMYHLGQIELEKEAIRFHEAAIKEHENPST